MSEIIKCMKVYSIFCVFSDSVIFGDSWLQNVHAVFDRDNNRVGFSSQ